MKLLLCQASDCMYNTSGRCGANMIQVNDRRQEAFCDTYVQDGTFVAEEKDLTRDAFIDAIGYTEMGAEFGDTPRISCMVSGCAYNQSFHCRADGVEIGPPHDSMICNCNTYRPK